MNRQHVIPQLLLRSWPFPRGAGRITDRFFSHLAFDDEVACVRTTDGFEMQVLPNDLIGRHIYLTGEFDRTTVEVLCKLAQPGDTLLDIGANLGYVSACFLSNVPRSTVIAVEPQPKIVDLCRANLAQFGDRALLAPVGISDRNGIGHLEICSWNLGASKINREPSAQTVKVEMRTPAQLLATLDVRRIDLIKLDVEGHEEAVLRALEPSLKLFQPRAILFEDHTDKAAPDASIGSILLRGGYRVFGIHKKLTRIDPVPIGSRTDCRDNDYIAVRYDLPAPIL
jgi:FkbM family methyltransferase